MNNRMKYFRRYLILIGFFTNLSFLLGILFLFYQLSLSGLTLPLFSEKVRDKLSVSNPNALVIASPILDLMSSLESKNQYFKHLDINEWTGAGASFQFQQGNSHLVHVSNESALSKALRTVSAGDTIVLAPGNYYLQSTKLNLTRPGTSSHPIRVTATKLGTVKVYLTGEGFVIKQPFWGFSNLHLIGQCEQHSKCEHAFHVVGNGQNVLIKNNILQDFNAMIKVNGFKNQFPDYGHVEKNTFFNSTPRNTSKPVTPIDVMHANSWRVNDNFIFDIQKSSGDKTSYAAFFKGGSKNGVFERNLVMCAANLQDDYTSLGLSLGGGGSLKKHRRNQSNFEHAGGIVRNNIIMHCANDVGIYLNRAKDSLVEHNTLYNTLGIDVRYTQSDAKVNHNVISGRIKIRDGGIATLQGNLVVAKSLITGKENLGTYFVAPDIGDFSWKQPFDQKMGDMINSVNQSDFCGNTVMTPYIGAFEGEKFCIKTLSLDNTSIKVHKK